MKKRVGRIKEVTCVFVDGSFVPVNQALVPISDRGFLYGDGVFSTLKVSKGRVEGFKAHLNGLRDQCDALRIECPVVREEWIRELIKRNHAHSGVWRLKVIVTGGDCPELHLGKRKGRLLMQINPYQPQTASEMRLSLYPIPFSSPSCHVKSLSYLDRLYMADYARRQEMDEALILSPERHILETAFANIFWKEDGSFFSPDSSLCFLKGSTLCLLESEIKVIPIKRKVEEISDHAHIYLCNSLRGIVPVIQVHKKFFSRDLHLEKFLSEAYERAIRKDTLI